MNASSLSRGSGRGRKGLRSTDLLILAGKVRLCPKNDWISDLLRCPRCKSRAILTEDGSAYRCADTDCTLSRSASFPIVGGQPVFVDFENSVVHREWLLGSGGQSVVSRRPPSWRTIIGRRLFGENQVAPIHAARLLSALKQRRSADAASDPDAGVSPPPGDWRVIHCKCERGRERLGDLPTGELDHREERAIWQKLHHFKTEALKQPA